MVCVCVCVCVRALPTQTVGQEVGREALGAMAHGRVVVRVAPEHQHGPAHHDGRVQVPEEAAVPQDGPAREDTATAAQSEVSSHEKCQTQSCVLRLHTPHIGTSFKLKHTGLETDAAGACKPPPPAPRP